MALKERENSGEDGAAAAVVDELATNRKWIVCVFGPVWFFRHLKCGILISAPVCLSV